MGTSGESVGKEVWERQTRERGVKAWEDFKNGKDEGKTHDHIHSEGHYYMSDKQAMNFCDLKTRHYKPRNFTNKFVGYVQYFVVFCTLSVNFVVYVQHL